MLGKERFLATEDARSGISLCQTSKTACFQEAFAIVLGTLTMGKRDPDSHRTIRFRVPVSVKPYSPRLAPIPRHAQ